MQSRNRELWLALVAILAITGMYLLVTVWLDAVPPASDLFGHSLGIIGFIFMLMTETLYTIRKRSRSARWGRMSGWLDFHIFTGIVGPFMVLLHSSWKFHGLAGIVTLMTLVVVVSGFIGRYIYTSIPRTLDGVEIEANQIRSQIQSIELELANRVEAASQSTQITRPFPRTNTLTPGNLILSTPDGPGMADSQSAAALGSQSAAVLSSQSAAALGSQSAAALGSQSAAALSSQPPLWGISSQPDAAVQSSPDEQLEQLVKRNEALHRQLTALAASRRLLALWHTIHIPLGLALFTAAFIHIAAAIYYATLLR